MSNNFKVKNGINIQPTTTAGTEAGDIRIDSAASNRPKFHNGSAEKSLMYTDDAATPAVDGTTIELNGSSQARIKDGAVTAAKLASSLTTMPQTEAWGSGSGTYTTPANARYLIVELIGGGGGGAGGGQINTGAGPGSTGSDTTFSDGGSVSLTAGGGGVGTSAAQNSGVRGPGGLGGSPSVSGVTNAIYFSGGSGGGGGIGYSGGANAGPCGGMGASGPNGGGGGGGTGYNSSPVAGRDGVTGTGSGGGGGGALNSTSSVGGGGGGAGGYIKAWIPTPAASYSYSVGAGGAGGAAGTSGQAGGAGGSGAVIVTAYFL